MSELFEYLEAQAREEDLPFKTTAAVAIDRSERRFGEFVSAAKGEKEFKARIALIEEQVYKIAEDVCREHHYDNPTKIARLALGQLEILGAARPEPEGRADSTQKLKSQKPDGYYSQPSPKMNPASAGDHVKNTNPPISELDPDERQDVSEKGWPWNSDIPTEGDGLKRTDVKKQKREQVGPNTQTFPNKNQAEPVTAAMHGDTWAMEDSEDVESLDDTYFAPSKKYDASADNLSDSGNDENKEDDELHRLQEKMENAKTAAERMDFNTLSEMMTPSDAIGKLVEAGMPEHEAKDRIDFYVNHVDPGWAHKSWTSAWDSSDPTLLDMSYDVDRPDAESIRMLYSQYADQGQFESPQDVSNALFAIYAEKAPADAIDEILAAFSEAKIPTPSNVEEVRTEGMAYMANSGRYVPALQEQGRFVPPIEQGRFVPALPGENEELDEAEQEDPNANVLPQKGPYVPPLQTYQHDGSPIQGFSHNQKQANDVAVYSDILKNLNEQLSNPNLKPAEKARIENSIREHQALYEDAISSRNLEVGVSPEQAAQKIKSMPDPDEGTMVDESDEGQVVNSDETAALEERLMNRALSNLPEGDAMGISETTGGPVVRLPDQQGWKSRPAEKSRRKPIIGDRGFHDVTTAFLNKLAQEAQNKD